MADPAPLTFGALLSSWLEKNVTRPLYALSLSAMVCYIIWVVLQKRGRTSPRTALSESNPRENDESKEVDSKPGPGSDVSKVEVSLDPQDSPYQDVQLPQHIATLAPAPQASHIDMEKRQDKEDEDLRTQPRLGPQEMVPRKREQALNEFQKPDVGGPREMSPRKREQALNGLQQSDVGISREIFPRKREQASNGFRQSDVIQKTPRENGARDDGQDQLRPTALGKLPRKRSEMAFEYIVPPDVHEDLTYPSNEGKNPRKKAAPESDGEGPVY